MSVLMPNHVYPFLRTLQPNLSRDCTWSSYPDYARRGQRVVGRRHRNGPHLMHSNYTKAVTRVSNCRQKMPAPFAPFSRSLTSFPAQSEGSVV
jgi:hypothetical protein